MNLLYVNVYAVTRHYGGPEEGGWWYNAGRPLASVPVRAKKERGHEKAFCWNCRAARLGEPDKDGNPIEFCKQEPTEDQADQWDNDNFGIENKDELLETWLNSFPEEFHLLPEDENQLNKLKLDLQEMFAEYKYGNIYSVRGGCDVMIRIEEEMAYEWPRVKPQYE